MGTGVVDDRRLPAGDKVHAWRFLQLLDAGYPVDAAGTLAVRPWHEVDLHVACELLARGCPLSTALDILR